MVADNDADRTPASQQTKEGLTFEPVGRPPRSQRPMIRILIGLMLFAGGGSAAWYGFKAGWYGQKSSSVPIIHANKDPIKVKPAKPGGMKVPDRDKLIYQRLGSGTKPQAPVEQLLPPAEAPMSPPSMPKSDLKKIPPAAKEAVTPTTKQIAKTPSEPAAPIKSPVQPVERLAPPPSPLKVEKVVPKNMLPKKPPAKVVERIPPPSPPKEVTLPVKKMVKKPPEVKPSKPLGSIESLLGEAPTSTAKKPIVVTKQASLKTPFRVQLAAVRTRAIAQKEWNRIKKKNADVLGKLSLSVMRADLGAKGTYYRLRAGPIASEAKARALCKKLAARKVPCLVIRPNG